MLFYLAGSSCSGKSTIAFNPCIMRELEVHDTDEIGVPSNADLAWRQETLESWMARVLEAQEQKRDVLLAGQSPLGELLATPSAPLLEGIAVALLDVADRERWIRLGRRDPGKWDDDAKRSFIGWARWHRGHAADPQSSPDAIVTGSWHDMRWARWRDWAAGDPRWRTDVIDTSERSVADAVDDTRRWIARCRRELRGGTLPLRRGWDRWPTTNGE